MERLLADTNALIRYFGIQMKTKQGGLSNNAIRKFQDAQQERSVLFISSLSIIEIWHNIEPSENALQAIRTLLDLLINMSYVRVVQVSHDVLDPFLKLSGTNLIEHDKIIYATAMLYDCDVLITTDMAIKNYSTLSGSPISIVS